MVRLLAPLRAEPVSIRAQRVVRGFWQEEAVRLEPLVAEQVRGRRRRLVVVAPVVGTSRRATEADRCEWSRLYGAAVALPAHLVARAGAVMGRDGRIAVIHPAPPRGGVAAVLAEALRVAVDALARELAAAVRCFEPGLGRPPAEQAVLLREWLR